MCWLGWVLGGALLLATPALADVPEVVITRLPTAVSDAPDAVVIDRQEIDARQAVFAADILTTVPGLALSRNGDFGGVATVRMRGSSTDKTLVLIDGVPQNDPSQPAGGYDFSSLDLADIERVEILSGPQGALWGSDAIGGVIAFTSRELNGWRGALEGGSLGTVDGSAAIGRRTDAWAAGLSVSGFSTDGISKAAGFLERDPFWTWTAGGYGRWSFAPKVSLDGRLRYNQSRASTDGYDPVTFAFGDTAEYATSQSWTGDVRAIADGPWGLRHTFTLGGYWLTRSNLGSPFASTYKANRQDYRYMAERGDAASRFGLAFGAEREDIRASLSDGSRQSLGATSGFVVARARVIDPLTLTGSLRYDAPDAVAGRATGRISAVWRLGAGFSLEGAWGQGFKTPTISEIACDFCFPAGRSTGLKPEFAQGWDLGLAWASADGRFSGRVTGYDLKVSNQIVYSGRYMNLARSHSDGVEAQADLKLTANLTLQGSYAYTEAVDDSTGAALIRIPRNAGSAALLWNSPHWEGALTLRGESDDADSDPATFSPATRPGFVLANLSGAYALRPGLRLTARIENLADTRYQQALGYGEPGRTFFIGIRVKG